VKEAVGDLWHYPAEYRVVTTNGVVLAGKLVMGAGVARQARDRFPELPKLLGTWVQLYGNRVFICRDEKLITLPTKEDWRNDSTFGRIERSLQQMVEVVNKFGIKSVVMPRVGCGLGGLSWDDYVRHMCEMALDDRFTVVTR
jgi:hypothetical protein